MVIQITTQETAREKYKQKVYNKEEGILKEKLENMRRRGSEERQKIDINLNKIERLLNKSGMEKYGEFLESLKEWLNNNRSLTDKQQEALDKFY